MATHPTARSTERRHIATGDASGRVTRPFPRNKSECVADILGRDILSGRLQPGQALPSETALLDRFAVSRTVLRDGFHLLAGKGLIDSSPRRGTSVTASAAWHRLDPHVLQWQAEADGAATLRQIAELRATVYPAAAMLAARHPAEADLAACDRALAALKEAEADTFHPLVLSCQHAIVQAGRNDLFISISHLIRGMLTPLPVRFEPGMRRDMLFHCTATIDAIRRCHPEDAEAQMQASLDLALPLP